MPRTFGFLSAVFLLIVSGAACAQWQPVGGVSSASNIANGIELTAGLARVRLVALSPTVVRVRYSWSGDFPHKASFAVVENTGFVPPGLRYHETPEVLEFSTGDLWVRVVKSSAQVIFLDQHQQVILEDHPSLPVAFHGDEFRVWKTMPQDEHYFGLGDKAGPLDHRDQAFAMWNTDAYGWNGGTDPLYKSIPFFLAIRRGRAYGVFLDNTYRSSFDFGKASRDYFFFGADGGGLDYYFIYGPDPKTVLRSYAALTGRTPLPPRFALGYQQSRYSYFPESRVRELARQFRSRNIPCDVIYLDIDYQDGYRPFTVDRTRFPDFGGMVRDLAGQGFKIVAITDPHIKQEVGYEPYDEGLAGDYFVRNPDGSLYVDKVWPGDSVFPDFTRAEVRQWFGNLYVNFVRLGVRGFWDDMNEPAVFRPEKTMPLDTVHRVEGRRTDHREIHNVYGMEDARATYEAMLRLSPDQRPYVLTRAAFAGTQRYAATWTGDNSATWEHLRLAVPTLLSLGVSGYSLVGADVGGFQGSPSPELLTRWMELGSFLPLYRNHADKGTRDREPWVDGPEHEAIRRRYIETRYRLLPYIYTSMEETSQSGIPLMRPMFLEYPNEESVLTADREFMFGHDLLVAPQLTETRDPYPVILPIGIWYDYWSDARTDGGSSVMVHPELDQLPVYVRGGAIIPQQPLVKNADEPPKGPLELRVYPGPDCRGSVYGDDGNTMAFNRGEFFRMQFTCDLQPNALHVNIASPQGRYSPWWQMIQIRLAGITAPPQEVLVGKNTIVDWRFDPARKVLLFTVPPANGSSEITVRF